MDCDRSKTSRTAWLLGLAGAMALAATSVWAGAHSTTSFGVGLRIAASCRVDSARVFDTSTVAAVRAPAVNCDLGTPRAVQVSREPVPPSLLARGIPQRSTVVVTLLF